MPPRRSRGGITSYELRITTRTSPRHGGVNPATRRKAKKREAGVDRGVGRDFRFEISERGWATARDARTKMLPLAPPNWPRTVHRAVAHGPTVPLRPSVRFTAAPAQSDGLTNEQTPDSTRLVLLLADYQAMIHTILGTSTASRTTPGPRLVAFSGPRVLFV